MNETDRRATIAHNLALAGELLRINAALGAERVPFLTWKGPVLAQLLYGHFSQRPFHDLDLLLLPEHLPRAGEVLNQLGYTTGLALTPAQQRSFLRHHHEQVFTRATNFIVELHWQIVQRQFAVDYPVAHVFQRAQRVSFQGTGLLHAGPEDTIVLCALHAAKHLWAYPDLLRDLGAAVAHVQDWRLAWQIAHAAHVQRYLACGLLLAERLAYAQLPDNVAQRARQDRSAVRLAHACAARHGHGGSGNRLAGLAGRERLRDRARMFARTLFTPTLNDWSDRRISDRWYFLYYFTRQARLLRGVVSRVARTS
jgi:hypothetical protein